MFKRRSIDNTRVIVVGITGGIAAGKTTVTQLFAKERALVLDADKLGQELLITHPYIKRSVYEHFGESILDANREIDRRKLGNIVFTDYKRLTIYNKIIHPYLITKIRNQIQRIKSTMKKGLVVVDAALIIEWKLMNLFDYLVLVDAPKPLRAKRLVKERKLSAREAHDRIRSQEPAHLKRPHVHFIIENDGTMRKLVSATQEVVKEIKVRSRAAMQK